MQMAVEPGPDDRLETPSYEEIVQMLTLLVEAVDVKIAQGEDRDLRTLYNNLQASLDAALRVEWASRSPSAGGDGVLFVD